jgi:hypothetical protein
MAFAQDTNPKIKNIIPIIMIEICVSLRLKEFMDTGLFILELVLFKNSTIMYF